MIKELNRSNIIPFLSDIFARRGAEEYLGEPVTIGMHMLQAAHFAASDGHDEDVVIAALLHDIGHFTTEFLGKEAGDGGVFSMDDTHDRHHEQAGALVLAPFFSGLIVDCARYHVAAKRYLCAREDGYFAKLSAASVHSLELQGGPMGDEEADEFAAHPHFEAIIAVRRYDEMGKVAGLDVPDFADYLPMLDRAVARH
ncbi:HD domain-containing protein [Alphaproteobacteria bacterium]|nr:HD domain-containing protein [Alphaproteobacteria bacterium]